MTKQGKETHTQAKKEEESVRHSTTHALTLSCVLS